MHPIVVYFLSENLGIYSKTIFHEKSHKKLAGLNSWLHPDLAGVSFPAECWNNKTVSFAQEIGKFPITLYSFELKLKLDFSNIRQSYFQAVSNSTWANEGYLVAEDICDDEEFIEELKRLVDSFGIGIIKLDKTNPSESEVILQAKYKKDLDWTTINKLVEVNSDFREFIENITEIINSPSKKIHKNYFDEVVEIF